MIEQNHPSTWRLVKLADLCESVRTVDAPTLERQTFRYVDISSINTETKTIGDVKELEPAQAPSRARQLIKTDDVLVSTVRPNLNAVARVPPELHNEVASTGFCVLRPVPELLDSHYLFYWTQQDIFVERLSNLARGAGYPAVTDSDVRDSPIPLPPLPEQQRIVAILRQADELRRLRRQADERTKALLPALFEEMFGDIDNSDGQWKVVTVAEAGQVQLGRQRAPQYQTGRYSRPYVRVANVLEDRIDTSDILQMDFDERDFAKYRLEHGDILLNEGQSFELIGRPAMWRSEIENCCFQNTLIRFRAHPGVADPNFALAVFLIYFRTGKFATISSQTSNVAHLSAARFAQMPFPLPPIESQLEFASLLEDVRLNANNQARSIQRFYDLFASLSAQAFTGELTAVWRELHTADLHVAAGRRDALLRERGARPAEPSAGERVRIEVRGKAGKSVEELMQGLFDTVRLTWDVPTVTLPQPLVETSRGLIGRVLAQATQRIAGTLAAPMAELTRATTAHMSETLTKSIGDFVQAAYAGNVPVSFEEEIAGHPREHLLRRLTIGHLVVWLTINTEAGYVTLESLYEATGLTHKALGRILDVLIASGLITAVSLPANPSGALVFVPAYRALDAERDEARAADLKLLEAR